MRVPLNQRTFRGSVDGKSRDGLGASASKSKFNDSYHASPEKPSKNSPLKGAVYKWVKEMSGNFLDREIDRSDVWKNRIFEKTLHPKCY